MSLRRSQPPVERRRRYHNEEHEYHDPTVLQGFWFDERARRDADYVDNAISYASGDTTPQKVLAYLTAIHRPVPLTCSMDGFLLNRSTVAISGSNRVSLCALPFYADDRGHFELPCLATGSAEEGHTARSSFRISRNDGRLSDDVPIVYGECIFISTLGSAGELFLQSEPRSPSCFSTHSGHQIVNWVAQPSSHSLWKLVRKDPEGRGDRFSYLPVNADVVIQHVSTGRNLALEKKHLLKTIAGQEFEISCHTYEDRLRRLGDENFWQIVAPYDSDILSSRPVLFRRPHCTPW